MNANKSGPFIYQGFVWTKIMHRKTRCSGFIGTVSNNFMRHSQFSYQPYWACLSRNHRLRHFLCIPSRMATLKGIKNDIKQFHFSFHWHFKHISICFYRVLINDASSPSFFQYLFVIATVGVAKRSYLTVRLLTNKTFFNTGSPGSMWVRKSNYSTF